MSAPVSNQPRRVFFSAFAGRQGSYQRKLLGCFLLVSFVLFLAFSLLVLRVVNRRYRNELQEMGQQTITQARNTSDMLLLEVFRYGLQSVTDDLDVLQLMYKEGFDTSDAITAQNILADMQKYNAYVNNIYIINFTNGSVLTKSGRVQVETFYDPELIQIIQSLPVTSTPVRYLPRVATVRDTVGRTSQERVWTVIFHPSATAAFVLQVNYDAYVGLLNIPSDSDYLHNYIINGDSQVLTASDESLFAADWSDAPLLNAVKAQPSREGSFSWRDPDTGVMLTVYFIQNAYLGLTYISTVAPSIFGGDALFWAILGLSGLFLLLSALGSLLLAEVIYRPVRRLRTALNLAAPAEGEDEFDQFRLAYAAMRESNDSLQNSANAWKRAEEIQMLRKWVDPAAVSARFTAEQYEPLEGYFTHLRYCCVLFNIDSVSDSAKREEELALLRYSITNMMEELAEGVFLLRSLDYGAGQTVHICNFETLDRLRMEEILRTVQNVLRDHFHAAVTVAVGCVVEDTDDLPVSLQSARAAAARRFANGAGAMIFCDELPAAEPDLPYPQQTETLLVQAVRAADAEETHRQLDAFFDALHPCRLERAALWLLQLDMACQRLETANHLDRQPLDLNRLTTEGFTMEGLRAEWTARLDAVIQAIAALRESNAEKLVARINALVEEKLCDPNLSVAWLADEVKLSVNYLRNVYKEATGESLSGHITSAKLGLVCQLLTTSDLTIQQISDKLGFTTRNYFFTFFKKHMGMTPKQYRLMQGNLQD